MIILIQSEFLIVFLSLLIGLIAFLAVFIKSIQSPLLEAKIFCCGFGLMILVLVFYLPSSILYTTNALDSFTLSILGNNLYTGSLGYFFNQCSYLAGCIGFLFISYALILPNFEPTYKSLTLTSLLTAMLTGIGFVLFFTVKQTIKNNEISMYIIDPLAYVAFGLLGCITIFVLIYRIKEIQRVHKQKSSIFTSPLFLISLSFMIVLTVITLVIPIIKSGSIPAYSFQFPLSLTLLLFAFAYMKDTIFLFITPITLDSFVCIHKTSGLALYSISTEDDNDAESLIGSIFQALNISLTEIVQSKQGLEKIRYGDKTALIVSGEHVISIIFASKVNFILSNISKHMLNDFEQSYRTLLVKESTIFNQTDFKSFERVYKKYNLYFN